jgi:hypothetical protein
LLTFAQRVILPKALDRAGEPTGSLLASYTVPELEDLLRASPFAGWEVDGEAIWAYAWAVKQSR